MIEVPDNYVGAVMEKIGSRKAELLNMGSRESGTTHMEFKIPARGLMGYRSEFLTDTNGNGIMNHVFDSYEPYKGDIQQRTQGSIIAHETGRVHRLRPVLRPGAGAAVHRPRRGGVRGHDRGRQPQERGHHRKRVQEEARHQHPRRRRDDALKLVPHSQLSLEQCLEFIAEDELVEVTPKSIRMRKGYPLQRAADEAGQQEEITGAWPDWTSRGG